MLNKNSIPGFTIIRTIGSGGMGIVYLAEDNRLSRRVAIKVLSDVLSENPSIRRRFFNEARLMGGLNHPNIVILYDFIEFNRRLALVMEFVDGKGLDRMIGEDVGPIPFETALPLFRQILDATGYAHERGIIHRDLKPSNILVSSRNVTKLTDFGIAKITGEEGLTRTGTKLGTLCYMSKEQVLGAGVDHRADIYSLGVTLYEMLSGRMPISDDKTSEYEIMSAIIKGEFPDPREFYPHIPNWLIKVLFKALSVNVDKRYNSCSDFMEALSKKESRPLANFGILLPERKSSKTDDDKTGNLKDITSESSSEVQHNSIAKSEDTTVKPKGFKIRKRWYLVAGSLAVLGAMLALNPFRTGDTEPSNPAATDDITRLIIIDSLVYDAGFQDLEQVVCLSDGRTAVWDKSSMKILIFSEDRELSSEIVIEGSRDRPGSSGQVLEPLADLGYGLAFSNYALSEIQIMQFSDERFQRDDQIESMGFTVPLVLKGNGSGHLAGIDIDFEDGFTRGGYRIVVMSGTDSVLVPIDNYFGDEGSAGEHSNDRWSHILSKVPLLAVAPNGDVYTSMPSSQWQQISKYNSSGLLEYTLELEGSDALKTEQELQEERARVSELTGVDQYDQDPIRPVVSSIGVDNQGRLWARRETGDVVFDVYDGENGSIAFEAAVDTPNSSEMEISIQPHGIVLFRRNASVNMIFFMKLKAARGME